MIKAILFDLDETLVNRAETMRRFLVEQHRFFPELVGCSGNFFADLCLSHQANGYASKLEAYESVCESLKINNNGVAKKLFSDFKERYGSEPVLFSGVFEVLRLLHGRYRLGLVTNGRTKGQMAKIDVSGMSPFFHRFVYLSRLVIKSLTLLFLRRALTNCLSVPIRRYLSVIIPWPTSGRPES